MTVDELYYKMKDLMESGRGSLEVKVRVDEYLNVVKVKNIVKVDEFIVPDNDNFIMIE